MVSGPPYMVAAASQVATQRTMSRLHFIGWNESLAEGVATFLTAGWTRGPLDLSDCVIVVSTAHGGQVLREVLVQRAAARKEGVLSPTIITPESLIDEALAAMPGIASPAETLLAWMQVLQSLPSEALHAIFPLPPSERDLVWARAAATSLLRLRKLVEEGGRGLTETAALLGQEHEDAPRWQALAAIEQAGEKLLGLVGLRDQLRARLAAAHQPCLPAGTQRLVVAGLPDLVELAIIALESFSRQKTPIDILIHAPPEAERTFDGWGRPLTEHWGECEILIPDPATRILLMPRPNDAARAMVETLRKADSPADFALATADPEVISPLIALAAAQGMRVFDPNGALVLHHELSWLIRQLRELLEEDNFRAASQLIRIPEIIGSIYGTHEPGSMLESLSKQWDDFSAAALPRSLASAQLLLEGHYQKGCGHVRRVVQTLMEWRTALTHGADQPVVLMEWLGHILERKRFPSSDARQQFIRVAAHWSEALAACERAGRLLSQPFNFVESIDFATHLLSGASLLSPGDGDAREIFGWLELPWISSPQLMIAGLNEGMIPASVTSDPWLPNAARAQLQLRNNATRLARDGFLLTSLLASRAEHGGVTLCAAAETAAGEPLKPSRLLLRCPPDELPVRALKLFSTHTSAPSPGAPAWHRAWKYRVPLPPKNAKIFTTISVTQFKDYLTCPFRFYLKHVLKMQAYDPHSVELEPRAYGNICHLALQSLHEHPTFSTCIDADEIAAFLETKAHDLITAQCASPPTVPLRLQLASIRQRLRAVAHHTAAARREGWRVLHVEIDLAALLREGTPCELEGHVLAGRIDLIETHLEHGLRVLDYKTTGNNKTPQGDHLATFSGDTPAWKIYSALKGKSKKWTNLQLPLYAWILHRAQEEKVSVCYFNMPKALSETKILDWAITDEEIKSAVDCARQVVKNIRAGIFWPPAPTSKFDDFKDLWHESIADSFDPTLLLKRQQTMGESG